MTDKPYTLGHQLLATTFCAAAGAGGSLLQQLPEGGEDWQKLTLGLVLFGLALCIINKEYLRVWWPFAAIGVIAFMAVGTIAGYAAAGATMEALSLGDTILSKFLFGVFMNLPLFITCTLGYALFSLKFSKMAFFTTIFFGIIGGGASLFIMKIESPNMFITNAFIQGLAGFAASSVHRA